MKPLTTKVQVIGLVLMHIDPSGREHTAAIPLANAVGTTFFVRCCLPQLPT